MPKILLCNIDLFVMNQQIWLLDNDGKLFCLAPAVDTSDLPRSIVDLANKQDVSCISLSGPDEYTKQIGRDILTWEHTMYEINKDLEIRINGEIFTE